MQTALQPRKGFQNLGFDGVLSSLSFAAERKGAAGGIYECMRHSTGVRIATASLRTGFAMTRFLRGGAAVFGGGVRAPRPTDVLQGVQRGGTM